MSILTNFLKLVKPEKNDYVDVEEHISKYYDIIDEEIKKVNDAVEKKADPNHTHDDRYYTESEIDTKFKNFCPFPINSLYLSLGSENPATTWLGTTWQKQEGRFLLGSSSSYSLGATGGASSIALSVANMPSHTHSASQSAHTHSQPTHYHSCNPPSSGGYYGGGKITEGSEAVESGIKFNTASAGGDTTGSSAPRISIGSTGSGTAFSILPPYLVVNIWKRLS